MEISGDQVMRTLMEIKDDTSVIRGNLENHEKRICVLEDWKGTESRIDKKIRDRIAMREAEQEEKLDEVDFWGQLVKKYIGVAALVAVSAVTAVFAIVVVLKGGM
jgi:hypothetical protein